MLQGHAGGQCGRIWQVLPTFERLLAHFEELRVEYPTVEGLSQQRTKRSTQLEDQRQSQLQFDESQEVTATQIDSLPSEQLVHEHHFSTNINLGWQKLNKYYSLLDESPVYVAAIVLHPAMKWQFIEASWSKLKKIDWIRKARRSFNELVTEYSLKEAAAAAARSETTPLPPQAVVVTAAPVERSLAREFLGDAFMVIDTSQDDGESLLSLDEQLREYLRDRSHQVEVVTLKDNHGQLRQRIGLTMEDSPRGYWLRQQAHWPELAGMAINIYSTPVMSDKPERQFSQAGATISPRRRLLSDETMKYLMNLRSWIGSKLIILSRYGEALPLPPLCTADDGNRGFFGGAESERTPFLTTSYHC